MASVTLFCSMNLLSLQHGSDAWQALCEALKGPTRKACAPRRSYVWKALLREAGELLFLMVAFNVPLKTLY